VLIKDIYQLSEFEHELKFLNGFLYVHYDLLIFPCHITWVDEGFGHAKIISTSEDATQTVLESELLKNGRVRGIS